MRQGVISSPSFVNLFLNEQLSAVARLHFVADTTNNSFQNLEGKFLKEIRRWGIIFVNANHTTDYIKTLLRNIFLMLVVSLLMKTACYVRRSVGRMVESA